MQIKSKLYLLISGLFFSSLTYAVEQSPSKHLELLIKSHVLLDDDKVIEGTEILKALEVGLKKEQDPLVIEYGELLRAVVSLKKFKYNEAYLALVTLQERLIKLQGSTQLRAHCKYYLGLVLTEGLEIHDLASIDLDSAVELFSRDTYLSVHIPKVVLTKAQVALRTQDLDNIYILTTKALNLKDISNKQKAECYNLLGIYFALKGNLKTGEEYFKRAISEAALQKDTFHKLKFQNNLGSFFYLKGNFKTSDQLFQQIAQSETINPAEAAYAYLNLGELSLVMKQDGLTLAYYEQALRIRESIYGTNSIKTADVLMHIAEMYRYKKDFEQALIYFERAEERVGKRKFNSQITTSGFPDQNLYFLQASKALTLKDISDATPKDKDALSRTLNALLKADTVYKNFDAYFQLENSRLALKKKQFVVVEATIDCLYQLHVLSGDNYYENLSLYFIDSYKQLLLTDQLKNNIRMKESDEALEQVATSARLRKYYTALELSLRENDPQKEMELAKLIEATDSLTRFQFKRINELNPYEVVESNYNVEFLKGKLKKNKTTILEYFWGSSCVYLMKISSEEFRLYKVKRDETFNSQLNTFIKITTHQPDLGTDVNQQVEFFHKTGNALLHTLIPSIQELGQRGESLLIIPDGELLKLSFAALPLTTQAKSFSELSYLVKSIDLRYAFSIQNWLLKENLPGHKLESALIVANNSNKQTLPADAQTLQGIITSSVIPLSKSAKQELLQQAFKHQLLHIGLHGNADLKNHLLSYFNFSGDTTYQDKLFAHEISNQLLSAELVVLASCETGLGEIEGGEGMFSLARSFSFAGCSNIVFSLAKVPESSSQKVLSHFYNSLHPNFATSFAKSLNNAQRSYLQTADAFTSHPYYWASFLLIEQQHKVNYAVAYYQWLVYLILLLLAGAVILFIVKRHR